MRRASLAQSVDCSVSAIQAKAPAGTTITGATVVPAEGQRPQYCRVDGHAASPGNEVNFRLGLPDGWNGKFLFQGVGGLGGTIANLDSSLARGYAAASTDTGHLASDPDLGGQPRERDRLRLSRHARHCGGEQGDRVGVLRQARAIRLLQRLLERRPAGDDGSAALSG